MLIELSFDADVVLLFEHVQYHASKKRSLAGRFVSPVMLRHDESLQCLLPSVLSILPLLLHVSMEEKSEI